MSDWIVVIRPQKRADYIELIAGVSRRTAVKAIETYCQEHGIAYRLGFKFSDGEQQICYADGYDGSLVLGKILRRYHAD